MWNQSLHRQNALVPITSRIEYSHASNVALSGNISEDRRPYPAGSRPHTSTASAGSSDPRPETENEALGKPTAQVARNGVVKHIRYSYSSHVQIYLNSQPCIYAHHTIITHRRMYVVVHKHVNVAAVIVNVIF